MIGRALAVALLVGGCYGPVTTREEVLAACFEFKEAACYRQMTCSGAGEQWLQACLDVIRAQCESEDFDRMTCWDETIAATQRCIGELEEIECSELCPREGCLGYTCRVDCP